ncbi:MAG: MFS transporter [Desulfamplus sp.]|nr:MFS transporter [Desulfamplus sp.]
MKFLLGTQYFVYFAVRGVVLPYFNLFCHHLGFSGFEIGLLSSVQTAAVMIFPVIWAVAADRFDARKPIFVICTLIASLLWSFLFFTQKFFPILIILSIQSIFYAPIISFLEAFAMDILGKDKKKYGKSRVWGTISFIAVSLILGKALSVYSTSIIVPLVLLGMIAQSALAFKMPNITQKRSDSKISSPQILNSSWSDFRAFFSLHTSLFLLAAFLMLVSHGAYYGFFSIYLESLGFSTGFIGFAWAVASFAEIGVMVYADSIFARVALKKVLVVSCFFAFVRWILLFTTDSSASYSVILFSQLLHAFTYGSFHIASILAIDKLSPEGTTFGQAVNNAITYGAGIMVGFFLSGIFYDTLHGYIFFASSFVAFASGLLILAVRFDA